MQNWFNFNLQERITKAALRPKSSIDIQLFPKHTDVHANAHIRADTNDIRLALKKRYQVYMVEAEVSEYTTWDVKSGMEFIPLTSHEGSEFIVRAHIGAYKLGGVKSFTGDAHGVFFEQEREPENHEKNTLIGVLEAAEIEWKEQEDTIKVPASQNTIFTDSRQRKINKILYESAEPYLLEISNGVDTRRVAHNTHQNRPDEWKYSQTHTIIRSPGRILGGLSSRDYIEIEKFVNLAHDDLSHFQPLVVQVPK
jgi:hypothetical protein